MGCCFSSSGEESLSRDPLDAILIPIPLPRTLEEWARAGVPALLRVHNWLRVRAAENAPLSRGSNRLLVRMAYFIPPEGNHEGEEFDEEVGEAVEEDDAALRAAAANVGNAAHGAPNLLKIPVWRRAASWVLANSLILSAHCDVQLQLPLEGGRCATLAPALSSTHVHTLLQIFREYSDPSGNGFIEGPQVGELLGLERKVSLQESAFFPLLFHAATYGGGVGARHPLSLTAPQWITAVDALCSLSEEGLLRLSFYHFARVGLAYEYEEGMTGSESSVSACTLLRI